MIMIVSGPGDSTIAAAVIKKAERMEMSIGIIKEEVEDAWPIVKRQIVLLFGPICYASNIVLGNLGRGVVCQLQMLF